MKLTNFTAGVSTDLDVHISKTCTSIVMQHGFLQEELVFRQAEEERKQLEEEKKKQVERAKAEKTLRFEFFSVCKFLCLFVQRSTIAECGTIGKKKTSNSN